MGFVHAPLCSWYRPAVQAHRARNLVTAVVAIGLIALTVDQILHRNNERAELQDALRRADTELVVRRAIVRDLERYRAEHARLVAELKVIEAKMLPDLDALTAALEARKVEVRRESPQPQGFYAKNPLELSGTTRESLAAADLFLSQAAVVFSDTSVKVEESGAWSRRLVVFSFIDQPRRPASEPQPRWYSRVNDDLRSELEEKREEKRTLDQQIGSTSDFGQDKRRLEELLQVYDGLRPHVLNWGPLIQLAFIGPEAVLSSGRLVIDPAQPGVELRGHQVHPLPAQPDARCRLLEQRGGDPFISRWEVTTATVAAGVK